MLKVKMLRLKNSLKRRAELLEEKRTSIKRKISKILPIISTQTLTITKILMLNFIRLMVMIKTALLILDSRP